MMSRPTVMSSFHHYAQAPFDSVVHSGPMYRQLPMRPPELPAGYSQQHTGHHGRTSTLRMSGPGYVLPEEELAQLQKLSSDYEPEATVSFPLKSAIAEQTRLAVLFCGAID